MRLRDVPIVAVLVSVLIGEPALAEVAQPVEEASERFNEGLRLSELGDHDSALAAFEQAYELSPNYRVLYNIAVVLTHLRRINEAVVAYERYLQEGVDDIQDARRAEIGRELVLLRQQIGRIRISISPEITTEVSVDGTEVGRTPFDRPLSVISGSHTIEVRAEGFHSVRRMISVAGGAEVAVDIELERSEPPSGLVVTTNVPMATIFLDGQEVGTTPLDGPLTVTVGPHLIEARRAGYEVAQAELEVSEGAVEQLVLELDAIEDLQAELAGALEVDVSERGDALLFLDGSPLTNDVINERIPVGPHRLEVELEGFETVQRDVVVSSSATTHVDIRLVPTESYRQEYEARARRARTSAYVTTVLGATLLAVGFGLELWNYLGRRETWLQEDEILHSQYWLPMDSPERIPDDELIRRQEDNDALGSSLRALAAVDYSLIGLGGAALLAGLLIMFLGPDPERYEAFAASSYPGSVSLAMRFFTF